MSTKKASHAFREALEEHYKVLKERRNQLYSIRDPFSSVFANTNRVDAGAVQDACSRETCEALWESAERIQNKLRLSEGEGYNVSECCHRFYVSETWLSEPATGDTSSLFCNWNQLDDCRIGVKNVFTKAPEERCEELALQIYSTRRACQKYFFEAQAEEETTISEEMIRDIHAILTSPEKTSFRDTPSSNDLGLQYLPAQNIAEYMEILLDFVNSSAKEANSFHERLLLGVLFFERFLWVHPFDEGNGRTARLLLSIFLKPVCSALPLPMFLRAIEHPRQYYIHSIRANPCEAPVCLAFYALTCLVENSKRILDVAQPINTTEPSEESAVGMNHTILRAVWNAVSEGYPSVKPEHILWLSQNPGFLVIVDENSCNDKSATVHEATSIAAVQMLTLHKTWQTAKVFTRSELFPEGNTILLSSGLQTPTPAPTHGRPYSKLPYLPSPFGLSA
jgi:hypothetical protein